MEKAKVVLVPCRSYADDVSGKIKTGVDLLGGIGRFVSPSEKILVKPNVLSGTSPEKAVTTHPAVLEAVFDLLQKGGCEKISFGDGPGGSVKDIDNAMQVCGLKEAADRYGVPMADFKESTKVNFPEGKAAREFVLAKAVPENDAIITSAR